MSIDWSEAPERATHAALMHGGEPIFYCDVRFDGDRCDGYKFYSARTGSWIGNPGKPSYGPLVPRPGPWNGQGLPPVGTVCEFCGGEPDPFDPWHPALRDGAKVTVIAHYNNMGSDVAVFTFADQREDVKGMQVEQAMAQCFRPIRTPEQIAAEEREREIREIESLILKQMGNLNVLDLATEIHDAGYRKVEGGAQ